MGCTQPARTATCTQLRKQHAEQAQLCALHVLAAAPPAGPHLASGQVIQRAIQGHLHRGPAADAATRQHLGVHQRELVLRPQQRQHARTRTQRTSTQDVHQLAPCACRSTSQTPVSAPAAAILRSWGLRLAAGCCSCLDCGERLKSHTSTRASCTTDRCGSSSTRSLLDSRHPPLCCTRRSSTPCPRACTAPACAPP